MKPGKRVFLVLFCLVYTLNGIFAEQVVSNQNAVNYLETFARLYGYVRFFHPADEASLIDWSNFAIFGAKRVAQAQNPEELKKILLDLFLPIAPTLQLVPVQDLPRYSEPPHSITPTGVDVTTLKKVTWQHTGVWLDSRSNIYQSMRLNRKSVVPMNTGFANVLKKLEATPFQKKEFRFSAVVKTESGRAQLWFRVDLAKGKLGFFDNMSQSPIESPEWKEFEIKGVIDEGAESIYLGAILIGTGHIFIDNFKLSIKEGEQWVDILLENAGFEVDKAGTASPQNWITSGEGYDFEIAESTPTSQGQYLIIKSKGDNLTPRLFSQKPGMGECIRKDIGNGLACILPLVLYDVEGHTYPQADQAALQALDTT